MTLQELMEHILDTYDVEPDGKDISMIHRAQTRLRNRAYAGSPKWNQHHSMDPHSGCSGRSIHTTIYLKE